MAIRFRRPKVNRMRTHRTRANSVFLPAKSALHGKIMIARGVFVQSRTSWVRWNVLVYSSRIVQETVDILCKITKHSTRRLRSGPPPARMRHGGPKTRSKYFELVKNDKRHLMSDIQRKEGRGRNLFWWRTMPKGHTHPSRYPQF